MALTPGLYETIVSASLDEDCQNGSSSGLVAEIASLDPAESACLLAQHVRQVLERLLTELRHTPEKQIDLCELVRAALASQIPDDTLRLLRIAPPPRVLLSILDAGSQPRIGGSPRGLARPLSPMSQSSLFTGVVHEPQLVAELSREFESADRVEILCSFIKWSGLRILKPAIESFLEREGTSLRVLTTSYLGATDYEAIECLAELPRTSIKFTLDTKRTRMHAKAYLFHRATGFSTAYIGSSNMSEPAMTSGLEWNLKVSEVDSPHIIEKFSGTFDTYWEDREFCAFTTESAGELRAALQAERAPGEQAGAFLFDIKPFPFQEEILERLQVERELYGRWKNLVVAATGTGKTVVAAFDFKRFQQSLPDRRAKLLVVAHREEILQQSLACFRGVLRDGNFGELLVGSHRPSNLDVLFCSVQSFNSRDLSSIVTADYYDYVVIDEFHHASAPTYRRLLDHLRPKVLVGLTATPERSDGENVANLFFDGHIAAEIRLDEAIRRKLLCPFQYFGVTDPVDLSGVRWRNGRYDVSELENRFIISDYRSNIVINQLRDKVRDLRKPIGIGFCVSVRHAQYMAGFFNQNGIPADFLTGDSDDDRRKSIKQRLVGREINFVFVVDLYNEGVDIPEVNTVLFLRPTESLTLFLQQLGRGLRLAEGKDCLTVLDFVGQAHRQFSFEQRFRALMGRTARRVDREIEDGCPHMPPGCSIHLERLAAQYVLTNIRHQLNLSRPSIVQRMRQFTVETGKELTLANFLHHYELSPDTIYRRGTWLELCTAAGIGNGIAEPNRDRLAKGLLRLCRADSSAFLEFCARFARGVVDTRKLDDEERLLATMFYYVLFTDDAHRTGIGSFEELQNRLRANDAWRLEIRNLLEVLRSRIDHIERRAELPFVCPLRVYSRYHLDEVLAALGVHTMRKKRSFREGVLYVEELNADLLFVTLNKSEEHYSPTTLYKDYAISDRLFHWESQSTTSDTSPTGRRYVEHGTTGSHVLLFVRPERKTPHGQGMPYTFLGAVDHVSHRGSRPMSIVWRLREPIPALLLREYRTLAAG